MKNFRRGNISSARRKGTQRTRSVKRKPFYCGTSSAIVEIKNTFKDFSATKCFTFVSVGFVRYAHSAIGFQ